MARMPKGWGLSVVAGVTALLAAGCVAAAPSGHPAARPSSRAHASAAPSVRGGTGNGTAVIGKQYPFVMGVHCGVSPVSFDGRAWKPVAPVPTYPGPRPVNGLVTETGSVDGTLTLTATDTLRFTANIRHVAAPFVVTFKPFVGAPVTEPACG